MLLCLLLACGPRDTRITLESNLDPANPRVFTEIFGDALFSTDGRGRWDVLLTRSQPSARDADENLDQTLHLSLFWKPVPGTTFAEATQTNALLTYCLTNGPTCIAYEGAGFVYLDVSRNGQTLTGRVESSSLAPTRRTEDAPDRFGPCRLTARFRATRDTARVAEKLTALRDRLGPRPPVNPDSGAADVR